MIENQMILFGNVGTDVDYKDGAGGGAGSGTSVAHFRLASTPRIYDRTQGGWRDLETIWITVKAFRTLADNLVTSLERGQPVLVVGKLRTNTWPGDNGEVNRRDVLEAISVSHDLTRGTAKFRRNERPQPVADQSQRDAEDTRAFDEKHESPLPVTQVESLSA